MKSWRILSAVLLCALLVGLAACNPFGGGGAGTGQWLSQVKLSDISVTVSGSGNVQVANEVKLAFGTGGKVQKIYVEEGDTVKKGTPLAELETDALELSLSQAELNQAQAELAVSQAELGELQAVVASSQAEVAKTQAQVSIEAAKFDRDRMKDVQDIKDDIEEAEWELKIAEMRAKEAAESREAEGIVGYWVTVAMESVTKLYDLREDLAELLGEDEYASLQVDEVKIKELKVLAAQDSLVQARKSLEQAQKSVEQARKNVEFSKKSLEYAQQTVKYTKKQLTDAVITAPFDGLVAAVNTDEGDIIPAPSVSPQPVIHLIDPTSMELEVEVDEIDIPKVSVGQKAIISLDAFPDNKYEGKVTFISSLPSPEAGVILYKIKIGFQVPPQSGIKVSMSADANIVLQERQGVLLVPSRAISLDKQGNPQVTVIADGRSEQRIVSTGVSDGFDTEIISGLNEGETVVVEAQAKTGGGGFLAQ